MQTVSQTFLALLLAHLAADFPLQSDAIIAAKKHGAKGLLAHGAVHYVTAVAALLLFTSVRIWAVYPQTLLLTYVSAHLALDSLKQSYLTRHAAADSTGPFLIDQALHLMMIVAVCWALTRVTWTEMTGAIHWAAGMQRVVLLVAVTYTAVIFAGGYLVRSMTRSLTDEMTAPEGEDKDALRNAGLYIGWLERFLVMTALLVQSPAMVGLILTGKSIARLGELKGPQFAEYFLIGTLLSVSLALSGGVFLMLTLYGTVLPK